VRDSGGGAEDERAAASAVGGRRFVLLVDSEVVVVPLLEGNSGGGVDEVLLAEMGKSREMERRVSAATMPPIECPTRITRTEGLTVGEGVLAATSRSMTLLESLAKISQWTTERHTIHLN